MLKVCDKRAIAIRLLGSATGSPTSPSARGRETASGTVPRHAEELVVTARKRTENLKDVPIANSAIDGDALHDRQLTDSVHLGRAIPNLDFKLLGRADNIPIRGVGDTGSSFFAVEASSGHATSAARKISSMPVTCRRWVPSAAIFDPRPPVGGEFLMSF